MSGMISRPTARPYSFMTYRGKNLPSVFDTHFVGKKARKKWQENEILSIKSSNFQICVHFVLRLKQFMLVRYSNPSTHTSVKVSSSQSCPGLFLDWFCITILSINPRRES